MGKTATVRKNAVEPVARGVVKRKRANQASKAVVAPVATKVATVPPTAAVEPVQTATQESEGTGEQARRQLEKAVKKITLAGKRYRGSPVDQHISAACRALQGALLEIAELPDDFRPAALTVAERNAWGVGTRVTLAERHASTYSDILPDTGAPLAVVAVRGTKLLVESAHKVRLLAPATHFRKA